MNVSSEQQSPIADDSTTSTSWFRLLVPAIFLGCAAAWFWLSTDTDDLQSWLDSAGPWAPIAFVSISVVLMSTIVPKTAVSVTAGALFGTALGSGMMVVIAVAAAALNYAIGHWWLRESVYRWLQHSSRGRLPDAKKDSPGQHSWTHAVVQLAAEAGFGLHLLIRLSPVPTMVISYSMGAVGARWLPYLAAAAAAIIPQVLWVHGGATATLIHNSDASTLRWISGAVSIIVAIAVTVIVPRQAMRRLRSQSPSSRVIETLN